jgi:cytidylate kinase
MNKIITIGREFGSGGRELGKRLADHLGIAYYDKEIIEEISNRTSLAQEYVHQIVEQKPNFYFPITVGRTLHATHSDYVVKQQTSVYAEQANVLREMAEKSDCIIVGRCADYILREHQPLRIFVYADMENKVARCRARSGEDEHLSDKELCKKIRTVDRERAKYYAHYTGKRWGNHSNYDICINTSALPIKECAEALAHILK